MIKDSNGGTEEDGPGQQGHDHKRGPGETAADRTHRTVVAPGVCVVAIPMCSDSSYVTAKPNLLSWCEVSHHAVAPGPVRVHVICLPDRQPPRAYSLCYLVCLYFGTWVPATSTVRSRRATPRGCVRACPPSARWRRGHAARRLADGRGDGGGRGGAAGLAVGRVCACVSGMLDVGDSVG